jgi:hypothetical protein
MDLDRDGAIELVRQLLASQFGENLKTSDGDQVMIQDDLVGDYRNAWSVPFNTKRYLSGGPPPTGLLPNIAVVPKNGVADPHFAPTSIPVREYLQRVQDGEMQWAKLPADLVTYFARISDRYPRSNPRGIARRRLINGRVTDEDFTRNLRWEPTDYFERYRLGHNDVDHVRITKAEVDAFIAHLTEKVRQ